MNRAPSAAGLVVARRTYAASRQAVFEAFTQADQIARWLSPSDDVSTTVLEFDFRPGGAYRLAFHFPGGRTDYVVGRYLEISEGTRLVYTWTWEEPDPFAGVETLVSVDFFDSGYGTTVLVNHDRFPTQERRSIHDDGWQATLARLARLFEAT